MSLMMPNAVKEVTCDSNSCQRQNPMIGMANRSLQPKRDCYGGENMDYDVVLVEFWHDQTS